MTEIVLTQDQYDELSDLIWGALENGLFGDALIDVIHGAIMDELELNIGILEDGDEDEEESS